MTADRPPARWFSGAEAEPIGLGCSGARVWALSDRAGRTVRYLKAERVEDAAPAVPGYGSVVGEAERARWVRSQGLPAPAVLDAGVDGGWQVMLSAAVPGIPMSALAGPAASSAVSGLAEMLASMHHLPTDRCPFRRDLDVLLDGAAAAVAVGAVRADDFDEQRSGSTPAALLALARRDRPAAEDLVVCHGDACLPNVLVDPESGRVTGLVDLGRLGIADRHSDLALAVRSLGDPQLNPGYGAAAAAEFLRRYPMRADPRLLDYYQLLDEFF